MASGQRDSRRVMSWAGVLPAWRIMADAVTAGLMGTGMAWREAEWRQGARWTEAAEAVFPIHARASLAARVGCALIDLHVAKGTWETCRQPHPWTGTVEPTRGHLVPFSKATPLGKDNLILILYQLLCKLGQPSPQPRAALHQITLVPKLT